MATVTTVDSARRQLRTALAMVMAEDDPIERGVLVHAFAEMLMESRSEIADPHALTAYIAQRSVCACGFADGDAKVVNRHVREHADEVRDDGTAVHRVRHPGTTYKALAAMYGVNPARIQQLISRGREVYEATMTPEPDDDEAPDLAVAGLPA